MSFCTLHLVNVAAQAVSAFTHILSLSVLGSPVYYLASHQIDAERRSLFFSVCS